MLLCAETQVSYSRSPLKVSVHSNGRVEVYPKADESINILNVKRGIISAFLVPIMEDGRTGLVVSVQLVGDSRTIFTRFKNNSDLWSLSRCLCFPSEYGPRSLSHHSHGSFQAGCCHRRQCFQRSVPV